MACSLKFTVNGKLSVDFLCIFDKNTQKLLLSKELLSTIIKIVVFSSYILYN
jgi:hypothetical protein